MKLPRFLTTPLPPSVVSLGDTEIALALLSRRRDALLRVEEVPVESECFRQGPVGLLAVDRALLAAAVGRLVQRVGKLPVRGTVVLPTAWVRCVQVETGGLPRQRREAEDVIRWRLKKLLPCRPEEVRIDFLPAGGDGRVMVALALDHPLSLVEDALAAAGMKVGRIEPTVLAVTNLVPPDDLPRLIVVTEPRSLGFVAVEDGAVTLLRQKGLPVDPDRAATFVAREVDQSVAQVQPPSEGARPVEVWVVALDEGVAVAVEDALDGRSGVTVRRLVAESARVPAGAMLSGAHLGVLLASGAGREA
ncbi:MAG: hypothetical protein MUF10_07835 [Thermoanaerobaculaceae bacterium]|jgi:hypothetical protein|nr:hypothetical protein [Thermoanaerobaculaceae bacterium]